MTRSITPGFAGSSNKHFTQFSPLVEVPCLCNQTARELRCSFNELIRPGKREKLKGKNRPLKKIHPDGALKNMVDGQKIWLN